tara:strand:- start:2274 stop:2822 length:549 start_codon:yes stop_codon:yes gene_type:complete
MSFDLTNKNIQDTFQNLLQQTGSNGEVYDLEGNRVTTINIGTISSSAVTASVLEIPNGDNLTGNKLHSRSGTLYFGSTNLETGGSGLSNVVEDTTPQLGGNLDLNSKTINSRGNVKFSGSLEVKSVNSADDFFLIKSGSLNSLQVNNQGVMVLGGFTFEPTAVEGGFYYNNDEDEYFVGKQN